MWFSARMKPTIDSVLTAQAIDEIVWLFPRRLYVIFHDNLTVIGMYVIKIRSIAKISNNGSYIIGKSPVCIGNPFFCPEGDHRWNAIKNLPGLMFTGFQSLLRFEQFVNIDAENVPC